MNGEPHDNDTKPGGAERRSRLRQYQVQLLERMQAAKSGERLPDRALGLDIGGRHYLLDLTQVGEIVPLQAATPVPLTQDWYLGLANIRGSLTGVIDLARYEGREPLAAGMEARLLSFAPSLGFNCALLASRVLGLRKPEDMAEQPDDEAAPPWRRQQWRDAEGQLWQRLDLAQLVREPRFLQVGL
ncbi:chemotaxis protein CheW [Massilia endophytica]|uniref:chemotaxis protein CheW n=1 Tax=Massilia endophytica TaxID=2899220 RepID=UPI001E3C0B22|nr:chemotaxis protein CheW [Massilia endophytica]UGQ45632.1 chemotaxis protein CheW [Massilia endophytica]